MPSRRRVSLCQSCRDKARNRLSLLISLFTGSTTCILRTSCWKLSLAGTRSFVPSTCRMCISRSSSSMLPFRLVSDGLCQQSSVSRFQDGGGQPREIRDVPHSQLPADSTSHIGSSSDERSGGNNEAAKHGEKLPLHEAKIDVNKHLVKMQSKGLSWTAVATGPFIDW